jgi:putative transcriptional regulator
MLYIYNICDKITTGVDSCMVKKKQIFITKIKALRKSKGVTQAELAFEIGVNRGTILAIENGTFNPSLKLAFLIARYFDMTIDEIFEYMDGE